MSKAPIAHGTTKPAASGPSASPAHGTGEPFKPPKTNPHRQPNQTLVTESLGVATPPLQDYGQGAKAPVDGAIASEGDYNPSTTPRP